jgi:hypothetical protein
VIAGVRKDHRLLAAFLEASDKIDWRALQRRVAIGELTEPVNVKAHQQTSTTPIAPVTPFSFRRANLVRASEQLRKSAYPRYPRLQLLRTRTPLRAQAPGKDTWGDYCRAATTAMAVSSGIGARLAAVAIQISCRV